MVTGESIGVERVAGLLMLFRFNTTVSIGTQSWMVEIRYFRFF